MDWLGLAVVLALYGLAIAVVYASRMSGWLKLLFTAGILMRPAGAMARLFMLEQVYNGSGDANVYFGKARTLSSQVWQGNVSALWDALTQGRNSWQGTKFMEFLTGVVVSVIGPTKPGTFFVFAGLALIGLLAFVAAYARAYPGKPISAYALLVLLFPSLWYWPSSIGKEAIITLGLGLAVLGFVGGGQRTNWALVGLGVFVVYCIRPEVAGVVVLSLLLAHWLAFSGGWTLDRIFKGGAIAVVGLVALGYFMTQSGVEQLDVEGVTSFMESSTGRSVGGGSGIEPVEIGVTGIPMALINILFRPFPWEASNLMMLMSGAEIWFLWGVGWIRRRNLVYALREWRSDRLLRFTIPFIVIYSIALGMMLTNLGIIARQRVFLFPFLFLLFEATPSLMARRRAFAQAPGNLRPAIRQSVG